MLQPRRDIERRAVGRTTINRDVLMFFMGQDRVHRFLIALHHIEHAFGEARFAHQFRRHQRRRRIDRAGLQDETIPGGDGDGVHPGGHHHGEIERRDAGDHTQRLAQGPIVDIGRDLVGEIALEQLRNAAGEFHHIDGAFDFALGIGKDLAVFGGDGAGQRVLVIVQQAQIFVHHPGAADGRRVSPGGKRRLGRRHRRVHFGGG